MGGSIALTIRFGDKDEWRGSCWTNVLPEGMWAAPFYVDIDTSKRHVRQWLDKLLEHRKSDPELEEIWGGWNKLAPLQYGLVVVDYVTSTLISAQGYSAPDWMVRFAHDGEKCEKWDALKKAGLLGKDVDGWSRDHEAKYIQLPFQDVRCGHESLIDESLKTWCNANFGLSPQEKRAWTEWFKEREE